MKAATSTRRGRQWLVAALVTLVFAAVLAREASLGQIVTRLRELPVSALLGALAWLALAGVFRALRLQRLLSMRIGLGDAYAFNQIYNLVTATVPTGIGEAASAWVMRRALRVPLHHALVSLFVGRFLDLVILLCLFVGVLLGGSVRVAAGGGVIVVAGASLCALLLALLASHVAGARRLEAMLERWATRQRAESMLASFVRRALRLLVESLQMLPRGAAALPHLALTLALQLASLAALHTLLAGAQLDLSYAAGIVCFVIYVLLRMLPLQGIGGIGTTAAWWAIALSMLGVPATDAVPVGAVLYVAFYALIFVLCLTCLPLLAFPRRNE